MQNLTEKQGDKPVTASRRRRRGRSAAKAGEGLGTAPGHDVDAAQDHMEDARDEPKLERL